MDKRHAQKKYERKKLAKGICRYCAEPLWENDRCFYHRMTYDLSNEGVLPGKLSPTTAALRAQYIAWLKGRYLVVECGAAEPVTDKQATIETVLIRRALGVDWLGGWGVAPMAKLLRKVEHAAKRRRDG